MNSFLNALKSFFGKIKEFYERFYVIVNPTIVLTVICIIVTLALSSTNLLTAKRIEELAVKAKKDAMLTLIEADNYPEVTQKIGQESITYNKAVKEDKTIGYIFTVGSKGYGGEVLVMTAVNTDGTVAAVDVLDASGETPGLGQNITKESFYLQYSGLKDNVSVVKQNADKENNEINAVTGATISSDAVNNSVNKALEYAAQIIAKGEAK